MKSADIQQFDPHNDSKPADFPQDQWYVAGFSWELANLPSRARSLTSPSCSYVTKMAKLLHSKTAAATVLCRYLLDHWKMERSAAVTTACSSTGKAND